MADETVNTFEPRKGLKRVLKCRVQTKFFFYYLIMVCVLGTLNYVKMTLEGDYPHGIMIALFLSLIIMLTLIFFVFRKFVYSELEILEDGIELREYKKKPVQFKFADIESVKLADLFHSTQVFLKDSREITIDSNFERGDYIIESIAAARPGLIEAKQLIALRNQAVLDDHANARVADQMSLKKIFSLHLPLVILMTALVVYIQFTKGFVVEPSYFLKLLSVFILVHSLINDLMLRAFELIFATRTKKNLDQNFKNVLRDLVHEKKIYRMGFSLLVVAYFAAIAVFFI